MAAAGGVEHLVAAEEPVDRLGDEAACTRRARAASIRASRRGADGLAAAARS